MDSINYKSRVLLAQRNAPFYIIIFLRVPLSPHLRVSFIVAI
ncbi:hypothetical protein [Calothrix sp. UHCC 0171]|nr:hypothetical protein [Calothrix sp. UHCC 0171]MEA5572483.1 hypothetical protein [Calothrix sp. UHCC 0171]